MPDTRPVTERDVVVTRSFAAPVATVWKFWTVPELFCQWYGPDGFSVPVELIDFDIRVGGTWSITMRNDETGFQWPLVGHITALVENEYLEIAADSDPMATPDMDDIGLMITFHDDGDSCRVTVHQGEFDAEGREGATAGWEMSYQKLDALL